LFAGQISTLKGADLALEAVAEAKVNVTLTFIGSGDYEQAAQRQAQSLGIGDRVSFAGRCPRADLLKAYAKYDVFLLPSVHDTGSFAILEAMYNELPVICLEIGGPAVAVEEGCGRKIPIGTRASVVRGLADAIREYAGNPAAIREAGARAHSTVLRRYDWKAKVGEMNEIYREVLLKH
jgi:glycosyltransferase involved in cell wall biosynthesis